MTRGLRRAFVLSILFHLLFLFSVQQLPWWAEFPGQPAGTVIAASLRPLVRAQPAEPPLESSSRPDEKPVAGTRELLKGLAAEKVLPISQGFSPSTASDNVAVVDQTASLAARSVTSPSARVVQAAEAVSLDGVRQYRLNLAREARQSKNYPDLARERGWEGVVVVVVTTVAGVPVPQVTLSQSSGVELLDRAATDLVELAVQSARMPDSLRGQQFALTLPIHYQLAE